MFLGPNNITYPLLVGYDVIPNTMSCSLNLPFSDFMESTGEFLESAGELMEITIANAVVRSDLSPELINTLFLRRRSDQ